MRAGDDRRERRRRHLDPAGRRLWLVYAIRRLDCPTCGVRTEDVPWARPGARHTRDFEDTVLWLAQRTDRTTVATLMRCAWETVTTIIDHEVAELLDERRLQTLYRIGVDEICYRPEMTSTASPSARDSSMPSSWARSEWCASHAPAPLPSGCRPARRRCGR